MRSTSRWWRKMQASNFSLNKVSRGRILQGNTNTSVGSAKKGGMAEKQDIGNGHIGFPIPLTSSFPICPFRYIHSYKMDISEMGISEIYIVARGIGNFIHFWYIHSYKMDISEMGVSEMEISHISISDFRYIHSYNMDISEMGISEMEIPVWKFQFPISLFQIYPFYSYGYIGMDISVSYKISFLLPT